MSLYMRLLIVCAAVPFIGSFYPPLGIWRRRGALFKTLLAVTFIYGGWDVLAVARGHWRFNPSFVGSVSVANLPLEEALFFLAIPFCCIFSWEIVRYFFKKI